MSTFVTFVRQGGPVMIAIIGLSVILYWRCCRYLLALRRDGLALDQLDRPQLPDLRRRRQEALETAYRQRAALATMIAAAPLLGLLGTVSGMVGTFEGLAATAEGKSMAGLAHGISEVLVATESGLAVAIPGMMVLYFVHSRARRHVRRIELLEAGLLRRTVS